VAEPADVTTAPPVTEAPELQQVTGRRATADVLAQIVGRVLNLALGVVVTLVIVRSLGDERFGQWSTVFAVVTIAGYFASLGLEPTAVRRAAAERAREPDWIGALITLRLALAVPVALVAAGVILALAPDAEMRATGLIATGTLLLSAPGALRSVFQLRVRNYVPIVVMTVNSVLWGAAVVAIATADGGMVAFAVAFLGVACVTNALQAVLGLRAAPVRLRGSRRLWGDLARAGVPLGIASLLTVAYGRIDQVIVFQAAGERDAGLYGAVYRILDSAEFIPIALMTTLFPIIAAAHPLDSDRVHRLFQRSIDSLALASLPILAFAVAAADPTVRALFGSEFADAAPALPVLMGAFVLICFGYLAGNMIIVLELQRRFVVIATVALVVNVALNVVLVPEFGFMAATWVTLGTEALVLTLAMREVLRRIELRPGLGRVARSAAAAAAMGGAVFALRETGAPFGALAAAAAVLYPTLALAARAFDPQELAALVRKEAG
jgi:O-antigen/teichoic acid export membrane protein